MPKVWNLGVMTYSGCPRVQAPRVQAPREYLTYLSDTSIAAGEATNHVYETGGLLYVTVAAGIPR